MNNKENNSCEAVNKIFVTRPSMAPIDEYIEKIQLLWDSHSITNMGKFHNELEKRLADYLDVPEIALTVNGHVALEFAIQSFGFPPGAEIITTPFSFVSTSHAIVRSGCVPVFCDIKYMDGTIDENEIEAKITDKTVAILPVHVYGNICNVDAIEDIARSHNLHVIYDAAHAFGETYKKQGIGNYGDTSIFSFHATKVFNTIEGGAVVCKKHEMYEKIHALRNFGIRGEEHIIDIGSNGKMNEFAAAMGLCNLNHIKEAIEARRYISDKYKLYIERMPGIHILDRNNCDLRNYAYFPMIIENDFPLSRDELYERFRKNGVYARKYFWPLIPKAECYMHRFSNISLEVAEDMSNRCITLPIYEGMQDEEIQRVLNILIECQKDR